MKKKTKANIDYNAKNSTVTIAPMLRFSPGYRFRTLGGRPSDLNKGGQGCREPGRIGADGEWEAGGRVLRG